MRIEGIEIEGFEGLTGSFKFPAQGLGVASSPNNGGKSTLARAILTAFYGPEIRERPWVEETSILKQSSIVLHCRLDNGSLIRIANDYSNGSVQVTEANGKDVTALILQDAPPHRLGEKLFNLTRREFAAVAILTDDSVHRVDGDPLMATLLTEGRNVARNNATSGKQTIPVQEIQRRHNELVADLRERRIELDRLTDAMEKKATDMRQNMTYLEELRAEVERIGGGTALEPEDMAKLSELIDQLRKAGEKRDRIRRDEERCHREWKERNITMLRLTQLQGTFGGLQPAEEEFLENFRQSDTLHRGSQALVKTETRFDETRLAEIQKARKESVRFAAWPLALCVVWIIASIILRLVNVPVILPIITLLLALITAGFGAKIFWNAKTLREGERKEIQRQLDLKLAQLSEFEKEQRYAGGRLALMADMFKTKTAQEALELFEEWKKLRPEFITAQGFQREREETDREIAGLLKQLEAYAAADAKTAGTVTDWQSLLHGFERFFEAQKEWGWSKDTVEKSEMDLATMERERTALRDSIQDVLESCGIDSTKGLADGIERLAVHDFSEEAEIFSFRRDPAFGMPGDEPDLEDALWQLPIASRVEEIARRFVSHVHEVEVDAQLRLSLKLVAGGPRLQGPALRRAVSPATIDQLGFSLRLAIAERVQDLGERFPVILDDPLVRADDARYDRAVEFLVEDFSRRYQTHLLTCHEMRTRWFLQQHPNLHSQVTWLPGPFQPALTTTQESPAWAAFLS
ncbi:MAG TPA: hypothetical protein VFR10_09220 [bacterium]|nr:hypothetical protein [bacterium]